MPTYALFPEIARRHTETRLLPENDFAFDLAELAIPQGTTLAVIVNLNNPSGGISDMVPLPALLCRHPETRFLVDEAFIGLAGASVVHRVSDLPVNSYSFDGRFKSEMMQRLQWLGARAPSGSLLFRQPLRRAAGFAAGEWWMPSAVSRTPSPRYPVRRH